jgi:hypothetical protein
MSKASSNKLKTMFIYPFKGLDMNVIVQQAFITNEEKILDVNRQQLDQGKDAKGDSLGKYRNFKYKNRFEPVDLKLTGDFRNKMTMTEGKKSSEIFSQDQKNDKLVKRYGKDIFGINKQYQSNVAEIVRPTIGTIIKEKLKVS